MLSSSPLFHCFDQLIEADACGGKTFKVNNLGWDDLTEFPIAGSREEWVFVNMDTNHIHPMHMHLAEFTVLNRQDIIVTGQNTFELVGEPRKPDDAYVSQACDKEEGERERGRERERERKGGQKKQ